MKRENNFSLANTRHVASSTNIYDNYKYELPDYLEFTDRFTPATSKKLYSVNGLDSHQFQDVHHQQEMNKQINKKQYQDNMTDPVGYERS